MQNGIQKLNVEAELDILEERVVSLKETLKKSDFTPLKDVSVLLEGELEFEEDEEEANSESRQSREKTITKADFSEIENSEEVYDSDSDIEKLFSTKKEIDII